MKKRILGTLLAAALVVTQAVSVFAAGSKTTQATPAGESVGKYEMIEGTEENFKEVAEKAPEVVEKIVAINEGTATLESIAEQAEQLKEELTGKVLVTKFFDVKPIDGGVKAEDGKYIVTFHVPNLTEALQDVKVLHYSTERAVWEVINPENVDYAKKMRSQQNSKTCLLLPSLVKIPELVLLLPIHQQAHHQKQVLALTGVSM